MRWLWIDRIESLVRGERAVAVKAVSLAEEHVHDHYPAFPIAPHALIVEGMAQTAGILVGEARDFKEKVVLAKIGRATFFRLVRPGETIRFVAEIVTMSEVGASVSGVVTEIAGGQKVAEIELMFSHADQNMGGVALPAHNFVFGDQFADLLRTYRGGSDVTL